MQIKKYLKERKLCADLFNSIIEKECNENFKKQIGIIKENEFNLHISDKLIHIGTNWDKNPIYKLFYYLAKNRYKDEGQFYHFFAKPEWVFSKSKPNFQKNRKSTIKQNLINNNTIQATSLHSLSSNDHTEYSEFFKRIDVKYIMDKNFDADKKNKYVFCFTKNWRTERFWREYADDYKGVCVGFRFIVKKNSPQFNETGIDGILIRDVYYDSGYDFEFINKLRYEFLKHFNKELFLSGSSRFALFYKREKFKWEDETRLLINTSVSNKIFKNNLVGKEEFYGENDQKRFFFNLNTDNCLFKLEITEIIIGKNADLDITELKNVCFSKNINARIWRNEI